MMGNLHLGVSPLLLTGAIIGVFAVEMYWEKHLSGTAIIAAIGMIIIFIGVIIHTILDGIGLSMAEFDGNFGQMLGLGVLFHRLPIGIFLSMILVPRLGLKKTWGIVIALALSTCIGFVLGHYTLPEAGLTILYLVQGLIAGSLLHVIFHNIAVEGKSDSHLSKGLGALAGFGALAVVEWIAPVHAHAHASILDIWIDFLFNAAPIWCLCAVLIAACYALKKTKFAAIGEKLCNWFDPQPVQSAFGGVVHIFSLTGIALLLSLMTFQTAGIWRISACLALFIARFCLKNVACCHLCRPEFLCSREKSFALWTSSSFTLIAIAALIASVLPTITAPIAELIESVPDIWTVVIAAASLIAAVGFAVRHRGLTILATPLAVYAFWCLFHETHSGWGFALALGIFLLFLYDYHPRDIAASVEHDHPWKKNFVIAAIISALLAFAPMAVLTQISENPAQSARIVQVHHHHEHDSLHEHEHHHVDESGYEHHHVDEHDLVPNDMHEHDHDEELAHEHEFDEMHEPEHDHDSVTGIHGMNLRMHETPVQFAAFILFILTGLFWIMRFGPRHLFETAQGKQHHKHG